MSARENGVGVSENVDDHRDINDADGPSHINYNSGPGDEPNREEAVYDAAQFFGESDVDVLNTPRSPGIRAGNAQSGMGARPFPNVALDENGNSGRGQTPGQQSNAFSHASYATSASKWKIGQVGEAIQSLFTPLPGETLNNKRRKERILNSVFRGLESYGNLISDINVNEVIKSKDEEISHIRSELEDRNSILLAQLEEVQNKLNALNDKCNSQQTLLNGYQTKFQEQAKSIAELEHDSKLKDEAVTKLENTRANLEQKLHLSAVKIENQRGELSRLIRRNAVKNQSIKNLEDEVKDLKNHNQYLREWVAEEKQYYQKLRDNIENVLEEAYSRPFRKRMMPTTERPNDTVGKRRRVTVNHNRAEGGNTSSSSSQLEFQEQPQSVDEQEGASNSRRQSQENSQTPATTTGNVGDGRDEIPSISRSSSSSVSQPLKLSYAPLRMKFRKGPPPSTNITMPLSVTQVVGSDLAQGGTQPTSYIWTTVENTLRQEPINLAQSNQPDGSIRCKFCRALFRDLNEFNNHLESCARSSDSPEDLRKRTDP